MHCPEPQTCIRWDTLQQDTDNDQHRDFIPHEKTHLITPTRYSLDNYLKTNIISYKSPVYLFLPVRSSTPEGARYEAIIHGP
jgi:hypothetical protein